MDCNNWSYKSSDLILLDFLSVIKIVDEDSGKTSNDIRGIIGSILKATKLKFVRI